MAFGADRFIIGADVKEQHIAIKGWTETTSLNVYELIERYKAKGVTQFFCTDVDKDGLLQGPSAELYKNILGKYPSIHLIASGGIATLANLETLKITGCSGAIIGKAIYENKISLTDLKRFL